MGQPNALAFITVRITATGGGAREQAAATASYTKSRARLRKVRVSSMAAGEKRKGGVCISRKKKGKAWQAAVQETEPGRVSGPSLSLCATTYGCPARLGSAADRPSTLDS